MKLTTDAYLVASGHLGVRISHPSDCNVFAFDAGEDGYVLVDTGVGIDTERIVANLRSDGIDPERVDHVFLTHMHTDHIGGAALFRESYGARIYAPEKEADDLEEIDEVRLGLNVAKKAGFYPPDFEVRACKVDVRVGDGYTTKLGRLTIRAIETPGHTRGAMSYLIEGEKRYLCCGDHISYGGLINLQNYPNSGSSLDSYRESAPKLAGLAVDSFFPGHGLFTINNGQTEIDLMVDAMQDLLVKGRFFVPNKFF